MLITILSLLLLLLLLPLLTIITKIIILLYLAETKENSKRTKLAYINNKNVQPISITAKFCNGYKTNLAEPFILNDCN